MSNIELIQALINEKADAETRLRLIPYDGTPEIKENKSGKYLYSIHSHKDSRSVA